MPEFLNHPSFTPGLLGFLAGLAATSVFFLFRLGAARRKTQRKERSLKDKATNLLAEKSALETEILAVRKSETDLIQKQRELLRSKPKTQEPKKLPEPQVFSVEALQQELKKQESSIISTLRSLLATSPSEPPSVSSPRPSQAPVANSAVVLAPVAGSPLSGPPQDDRDFVPIQSISAETLREAAFEGFMSEPTATKAESAANTLRAALVDSKS